MDFVYVWIGIKANIKYYMLPCIEIFAKIKKWCHVFFYAGVNDFIVLLKFGNEIYTIGLFNYEND